jgi:hypothetical protein
MKTSKTVSDSISDLEGLIRAHLNTIKVTTTNMTNDEFFERSRKEHLDKIAWHQQCIKQLEESRESGPKIIADCKKRIQQLKKMVVIMKYKRQAEKLLELQTAINSMTE